MTVRFELNGLAPNSEWGMNRVYAGEHWGARKRQAQVVHMLVKSSIRAKYRHVELFEKPVRVRILYNSRLDIDNHGYLSKLFIDGMKGLLIEDDDRRYVRELVQGFHNGDRRKIIVEVTEI